MRHYSNMTAVAACVVAGHIAAGTLQAGPSGFRGDGSGLHADATPATNWTEEENIVWKTKMPSWSNGSPVPAGEKVFTCAEPCTLVCVSAADGAILWQATNDYWQILSAEEARQLREERVRAKAANDLANSIRDRANKLQQKLNTAKTGEEVAAAVEELTTKLGQLKEQWQPTPLERQYRLPPKHGGTGYTTPTPVSDGKHVWIMFGNGVAACYTVGGERKWIRLIAKPTQGHGHGASPRLVAGKLIVAINAVHGLDAASGEEVWRAQSRARWGTPIATKVAGTDVVITAEGQIIDVADGKVVRTGMGGLSFNCPVIGDGMAFFLDSNEVRAYRLPQTLEGDTKPEQVWKIGGLGGRAYASPLYHDGLVYGVSDSSAVVVLDAKTGEKVGEKKLGIRGACYTSLAAANDRIIAGAEGGEIAVLKAGRECELVAKNKIDKLRSSPVAVGNRLYFRTMDYLYCIGTE